MRISRQNNGRDREEDGLRTARPTALSVMVTGCRSIVGTCSSSPTPALASRATADRICCPMRGIDAGAGSPPTRIRRRKVQALRRQLKEGKYDIDSRLGAILDRILENLTTI